MKKTLALNFSEKHKDYIRRCAYSTYNFAEGSVRAGKTIANIYAFRYELENTRDKIHLATGSTLANAKLNIGEANGFGLEYLFRGRCRWGKFKDNPCLYVHTKRGERIVIFTGGGKSDSFKKIRGNSYGLWIATEINLHHEDTIREAFNRQLASNKRKIFWDLNPDNPNHFIYTQYIDKYSTLKGYNYEHFTLEDNINIPAHRIREIKDQYDTSSIWYRRDILGERCVAEGLIYPLFGNNSSDYIIDANDNKVKQLITANIGIDFGGNAGNTAFVCTGFTRGYKDVIILESERVDGTISPDTLEKRYLAFCTMCIQKYGLFMNVFCDSAEQILIRGIYNITLRQGIKAKIRNAVKLKIIQRIRLINRLLGEGRFFVLEHNKYVIKAMQEAVWQKTENNVKDVRLDNGSTDIDTIDALEYSIEPNYRYLINYAMR